MSYCFQHCDCNPSNEDWSTLIENNPEYWPFEYVTVDGKSFTERKPINEKKSIGYWCFNGNFDTQNNDVVHLEIRDDSNTDVIGPSLSGYMQADVIADPRYMCPPDMLRYCDQSCKVNGLFAHSGIERIHSAHNNYESDETWTVYGITGRICPYMLLPVSKTKDLSYMFTGCKKLTSYSNEDHTIKYLIPKDFFIYAPNITNLSNAFSYMLIADNTDLDIFRSLKNPLDISYAFFGAMLGGGTEDTRLTIKNIFVKNNIDNLYGVFANSINGNVGESTVASYEYKQYITFDGIFNNKYSSGSYATSNKFKYAFSGYSEDSVEFNNKSLSDSTNQYNYAIVYSSN